MKHFFPLNCQNAYGRQTFQGGGMLRRALIHKYAWHFNRMDFWGHVTQNKCLHL